MHNKIRVYTQLVISICFCVKELNILELGSDDCKNKKSNTVQKNQIQIDGLSRTDLIPDHRG